jgi:hypothetical protein
MLRAQWLCPAVVSFHDDERATVVGSWHNTTLGAVLLTTDRRPLDERDR